MDKGSFRKGDITFRKMMHNGLFLEEITGCTDKIIQAAVICDYAFSPEISFIHDPLYNSRMEKTIKNGYVFTACESGKIAGYAILYANDYDKQGLKIGRFLMDACVQKVKESGMHRVRLEVSDTNTNAILFYKKYGFVKEEKAHNGSTFMLLQIHQIQE
jgi:hypothetical protein